jgi:hypothetical protein
LIISGTVLVSIGAGLCLFDVIELARGGLPDMRQALVSFLPIILIGGGVLGVGVSAASLGRHKI